MKFLSKLSFVLILFAVALACKDDDPTPEPAPTAALEIQVANTSGDPQPGSSVRLYGSLPNYLDNENIIGGAARTTDGDGKVTYSGLDSIVYFARVQNGSLNNNTGGFQLKKLTIGKNEAIIFIR